MTAGLGTRSAAQAAGAQSRAQGPRAASAPSVVPRRCKSWSDVFPLSWSSPGRRSIRHRAAVTAGELTQPHSSGPSVAPTQAQLWEAGFSVSPTASLLRCPPPKHGASRSCPPAMWALQGLPPRDPAVRHFTEFTTSPSSPQSLPGFCERDIDLAWFWPWDPGDPCPHPRPGHSLFLVNDINS